jgi:hypothetical protein
VEKVGLCTAGELDGEFRSGKIREIGFTGEIRVERPRRLRGAEPET